jgi:hypothetical protein
MLSLLTVKNGRLTMGIVLFLLLITGLVVISDAVAESESIEFPNKLSLFGGVTQESSEIGASLGLEYEYRLNQLWGIGGLVEYAGGDFDVWVLGIPAFIHPYAGWFIRLAPGLEIEESESSFLFRAGVGYDFELLPRWSLAPEFNADFIEGGDTLLVYGLTLSYTF